jgi:uncharacterized protein (TIGR02646 family)
MIRLRRGPPPQSLAVHSQAWTARWLAIHAGQQRGEWATSAARKLLSAEILRLTHGKCAFCEGLLEVTSYAEIEHYNAKTIHPGRAFQWENLFPICRFCNGSKRDIDHGGLLLKPDIEDPEILLWLNPDSGELEPNAGLDAQTHDRVERTFEICKLQRGALCAQRIKTMTRTIHWLERVDERRGSLDRKLQKEWKDLTNPVTEFKFVIRHVLRIRGLPQLVDYDRVKFEIEA